MALNKFMHPRNIYKKPPDFKQLAVKSPEFRKHIIQDLTGKVSIDFKNAEALRSLTVTLLREDFGLDVELPLDRLIPTLPLRLNYIHWLEDIVQHSRKDHIRGIDIGTGASCVYPLLGCKLNNWQFLATEIDLENLVYARKNVNRNGLEEMITVKNVPADTILQDVCNESDTYDFCMCNPPFFADHMEAQALFSRTLDRQEPSSSNTASYVEQISEGGEKAFVKKMISQSLELKDKVRVFTSMLGKKASVAPLKEELKRLKVPNFSTTEFCQGKTMRWGLAWTFDDSVQFPKSSFQAKKKEKPPLKYVIPKTSLLEKYSLKTVGDYVQSQLDSLKIKYEELKSTDAMLSLSLCASQNTWSNQRRKRRERARGRLDKQISLRTTTSADNLGSDSPNIHHPADSTTGVDLLTVYEEGDNSMRGDNTVQGDNPVRGEKLVAEKSTHTIIVEDNSGKLDNQNIHYDEEKRKKRAADDQLSSEQCKRSKIGDREVGPSEKTRDSGCFVDDFMCDSSIENICTATTSTKESVIQKKFEIPGVHGKSTRGNADNPVEKSGDSFLLKCSLTLRRCGEDIEMEMVWIDGQNREVMHQVMQYFKNRLNPIIV